MKLEGLSNMYSRLQQQAVILMQLLKLSAELSDTQTIPAST